MQNRSPTENQSNQYAINSQQQNSPEQPDNKHPLVNIYLFFNNFHKKKKTII